MLRFAPWKLVSVLAIVAAAVFVRVRTGLSIPVRWAALPVYTGIICWLTFKQYRSAIRKRHFWLIVSALMIVHLTAFILLLTYIPHWPLIWFVPTTVAEVTMIAVLMEKVFPHTR